MNQTIQNSQNSQNWKFENKRNISQRLTWVRNKEDGIVIHYDDDTEEILVVKKGDMVFLHFVEQNPNEKKEDVISDVMSFIDTANPLILHSPYAQAMLMSLAFVSDPSKLYMLGFGGGRIPMILHHHLPQLSIESSEQSKGVVSLLEMCFGIKTDERLKIDTTNGKEHLQSFSPQAFDIIMLDTFSGAGIHPNELSSVEFYKLCKSKLSSQGVVATNLVSSCPDYKQKVQDFCDAFRYTYSFSVENNHVYIGSDAHDISRDRLSSQANDIDEKYGFDFKLTKWVDKYTFYGKKSLSLLKS